MKTTFTKKAMAIALLLCCGLMVRAQADSQKYPGFLHESKNFKSFIPSTPSRAPKKSEEEGVKLTINIEYDKNMYRPYVVSVYNKDNWYNYFFRRELTTDIMVKPGTYDIYMVFETRNQGLSMIIKELEVILQDTEIALSPEMATNHISVKNYGPDGTILKQGLAESINGELIPIEEGNVRTQTIIDLVICKEIGLINYMSQATGDYEKNEEWRTAPFMEIDVNDVSDRYLFVQNRLSRVNDDRNTWYENFFWTDNVNAGVLENDPQNYVLTEDKWTYSPFGKDQMGWGHGIFLHYEYDNDTQSLGKGYEPFEQKPDEDITVGVYINYPPMPDKFKIYTEPYFVDYIQEIENEEMGIIEQKRYHVHGVPVDVENGEIIYKNIHHRDNNIGMIGPFRVEKTSQNDRTIDWKLSPHPSYTYPASKRLISYGSSCPINAVEIKNYTASWMTNSDTEITSCYVGRCGEIRWCDEERTVTSYKFNGEEVENGEITETEGVFDVTIENTNMVVDGLDGRNYTCLHYDMTKEDNTPPTIEMLIFKNKDDEVTDRFAEGTDGIMEFSAADFNYQYYEEYYAGIFDCQPLNIQVEYAPYGTEEWTALEIEEIPELYREVGWGYFYHASLKDITGEAEKGWFDLRFNMSDETGNTHVQTVSPAFRIDDCVATGISETVKPIVSANRTYFSFDGKCSSTPQKGLNIVRQADGTVHKVTVR